MGYFANAGQVLVEFAFGIVSVLLLLRVMLQFVRADFNNPICQFLYKASNPILMPLGRLFPVVGGLNTAGLALVWVLQSVKWLLIGLMLGGLIALPGMLVLGLYSLIDLILLILFWTVILRIVLSFVAPDGYHPVVPLTYRLTEPLLAPVRGLLPSAGGLDFSPIIVTLGLYLARILIAAPIRDLGLRLASG
jgi:YggT family protein